MKSYNDQIRINIRTIENEQVPEWIAPHTVWVETKSKQDGTIEDVKNLR